MSISLTLEAGLSVGRLSLERRNSGSTPSWVQGLKGVIEIAWSNGNLNLSKSLGIANRYYERTGGFRDTIHSERLKIGFSRTLLTAYTLGKYASLIFDVSPAYDKLLNLVYKTTSKEDDEPEGQQSEPEGHTTDERGDCVDSRRTPNKSFKNGTPHTHNRTGNGVVHDGQHNRTRNGTHGIAPKDKAKRSSQEYRNARKSNPRS